jgi:hypothetical protein
MNKVRRVSFQVHDENENGCDTGASTNSLDHVIQFECDPILCVEDYEARWFTPKELQQILLECKTLVSNSSSNNSSNVTPEVESSLRGLEMIMGSYGNPILLQRRREWTRAVLQEQERLRKNSQDGSVDPLALAEMTKKICGHRQRVAHLRGLQDAQSVHEGDEDKGKRSSLFELGKHTELRQKRRTERRERRNRDNLVVRSA